MPRISLSHLPERFGLLVILAIGETVIGSVKGFSDHANVSFTIALCFLLSLSISFIIWWIYTDHVLYRAFKPSVWYALGWCYLHLPLAICITAIGTAMHGIVSNADAALEPYLHWLVVGFLASFLLIILLLQLVSETTDLHHKLINFQKQVNKEFVFTKVLSIVLLIIISGVWGASFVPVALLISILLIMLIPTYHGLNLWVRSHLHTTNQHHDSNKHH